MLKPVPPNSTVVGVPGRVVKRNNKKMPRAEMDQVNLPDPVLDALIALQKENRELREIVTQLQKEIEHD